MMENKFNIKVGNLELRSCNKHLLSGDTAAEIVEWLDNEEDYWTLAYWKIIKNNQEINLNFVGSRPFSVDKDIFWKLAELGQELLNTEYNGSYT